LSAWNNEPYCQAIDSKLSEAIASFDSEQELAAVDLTDMFRSVGVKIVHSLVT